MPITFYTKHNIIIGLFFLFFSWSLTGCTKFVQISPPGNQLVTQSVFSNDGSATGAVNGIYSQMTLSNGFASGAQASVTQLAGMSADDFIGYTPGNYQEFFTNSINISNGINSANLWTEAYGYIYTCNAILEGLNNNQSLSPAVNQELNGEAKFIRAFCYFYLTNLYGDVPLYTSSNYEINAVSLRTQASLVYAQIISDLRDAQTLLSVDYSIANGERIKPTKWAATALLARAYLYESKWDSAEAAASQVIDNVGLYSLPANLDSVFLKNSSEAIWQLLPVQPGSNTREAANFILTAKPTVVSLTNFIVSAFEMGDNRRNDWVGTYSDGTNTWYFAHKYKVQASPVLTEYSMVLRLAEQYLIRAEARAQVNNISASQADLNMIRNRAGLSNTTAGDQASLLLAIEHERQVELFSEWGHRWLDLNRTSRADAVLGAEKPSWKPTAKLYPVPSSEILNNLQITQNPGY